MRFDRFDLIRYGKFTGRSMHFAPRLQDFHLIVGPNEAGKSTLRAAILDLLFGIEVRSTMGFRHPMNELRLGAAISQGGQALEFERAKAQKNTLRCPGDTVLPDTALHPFLGEANRAFFDQMFGLDHTRLIEGGNSILKAEGNVGQVLFQSAAGIASLGRVRDALDKEADSLWGPRKANDRAYYIAAAAYEKASATLKEATIRTGVWSQAQEQVAQLEQAEAGQQQQHGHLRKQRARLERIRRTAPYLRALRENEQSLAALGPVIDLPETAGARVDAARRELAMAQGRLQQHQAEEAELAAALKSLSIDAAILAVENDVLTLEERRLQTAAHETDISHGQQEIAALWAAIRQACTQLGWACESEEGLSARLPTRLVRRELGALARRHSGLEQTLRAAEQAERARQTEMANVSARLQHLAAAAIAPELRAALTRAQSHGNAQESLQRHEHALAKAETALQQAQQALATGPRESALLAALPVPPAPAIERQLRERQAWVLQQSSLAQRLHQERSEIAASALELEYFQATHQPVTHEAVQAARQQRDALWQALRRTEAKLASAFTPFEDSLVRADQLADACLRDAEAAAELQTRAHALAKARLSLQSLEAEQAGLTQALSRQEADWQQQAQALGLAGLPLENLPAWLLQRQEVLARADAVHAARAELDYLQRSLDLSRQQLAHALGAADLACPAEASLEVLCAQAQAHMQHTEKNLVQRDTYQTQLHEAQTLLASLHQTSQESRAALASWQQDWQAALARASLEAGSDLGTVEGALELADEMEDKLAKIRQIRLERIAAMQASLDALAQQAGALVLQVDPALAGQPAARIARALTQRLAEARASQQAHHRCQKDLMNVAQQVREAQTHIAQTETGLQPLLDKAQVTCLEALEQAIARSDQKRKLEAARQQARIALRNSSDGLTRELVTVEVDAADPDQVQAELAQVEHDLSACVAQLSALAAERARAQQERDRIGGSDAAARAEAQRQEAAAQMADAAERYVRVHTAARLLRWAIDRYREEKQGPMLARASAIFSQLTQGGFQRLVVDFEREPPTLQGQRASEEFVAIAGMSDGTRDQLYLALRLAALELHLEQATPLPFIADDLFINYDDGRCRAGLEALAHLSRRTQVIFLSHHDHLVSLVQEVLGQDVNVVYLQDAETAPA